MPGKLEDYNRKRDFKKSDEPEGRSAKTGKRLRFVVQHHLAQADHYDFRLEWDGAMLSWAVPKGPSYNPDDKRLAVEVEDHPLEYRNFEGTIPKGEYGAGTVMIWDEGYWEPLEDVAEARKHGSLKLVLSGKRLRGAWALVRMKPKPGEPDKNWLLFKEKDRHVLDHDGISGYDTSIRSGRTMEEIAHGRKAAQDPDRNPFKKTDVMLARLVSDIPNFGSWLYELKYDGYRIISYIEGGRARLITRNGLDYTSRFQRIADSLAEWSAGRTMVLDGEMVIPDATGKTEFQALQNNRQNPAGKDIVYIVFDFLAFGGKDLRNNPLEERKAGLEALLADAPENIRYSSHVRADDHAEAKTLFQTACDARREGLIAKKADSPYGGSRNGDWIKIKCGNRQEFVIGGYTLSSNKRSGFSSLLLGYYSGKELIYAGRAGTGFSQETIQALGEKFAGILSKAPPFKDAPQPRTGEKITWLKPVLVAEIEFAEWTGDNLLRQASFQGIREDRNPEDVVREIPRSVAEASAEGEAEAESESPADSEALAEGELPADADAPANADAPADSQGNLIGGVRISSPDKRMIAGTDIAKRDVARYYEKMYPVMAPYLEQRLLSTVRCPDGTGKACFYERHPAPDTEGIVRVQVLEKSGKTAEYSYIESISGLLSAVQMGALEFHTWGSRADDLERPDMMVFDLDPAEGLGLEQVRQGVRDLKGILDEIELEAFLKTSGGKGYHVVIPLEPSAGWDAFHEYARLIAQLMEQRWPDRYTSNVRKVSRQGKVFIDWLRNGRAATSVAPYSIRARADAPVSMPIFWEELDTIAPNGISMDEALTRLNGKDPWKDFWRVKQRIKESR